MPEITVNGYALSYAEAGSGTPLVMVHGTLQDQRYWAPQMAAFAARCRPMALSLRHYWPARWDGKGGGFTIAQHTADVAAFIRAIGGRAHLLGHSRGGHIAFRVASEHPELIERLILAEPGGELDETLGGTPTGGQAAGFAAVAAEIAAGRTIEGLRLAAEQTGGPGAWEKRTEAHRQVSIDNAMTMVGQVGENRLPFGRAAAEAITAPTLLVNGDQTRPNFIAIVEALARVMRDARRAVIPNATHGMSADNPAAFNAAVLGFLGG